MIDFFSYHLNDLFGFLQGAAFLSLPIAQNCQRPALGTMYWEHLKAYAMRTLYK